jgi:hypothetical protein
MRTSKELGYTNGVGRIAARVIEPFVVREPLPKHKLITETRRCRWFGSAQAGRGLS